MSEIQFHQNHLKELLESYKLALQVNHGPSLVWHAKNHMYSVLPSRARHFCLFQW